MLVAGEQCYTDAAKAVGCTDTDAVYTWGNLGTDSTDAVQSTEASRFAYSAAGGVGGRPGCSMDGAADFMDLTGLASTSNDYTVFAVVNKVATSFGYLFSTAGTGGQAHAYSSDLGGEVEYVNDSAGASVLQASMTGEQMLTWRVEGTADVECWRDGALLAVGSGEAGNNPEIGGTTYLGKNKNGTNWDEGVYSFFMIVPTKLSDADLAAVHAILLAEYGLAFDYDSVADLTVAYKSDEGTTGDPVSAWAKALGTGSDFVQATEADKPPLGTIGSRAALNFVPTDNVDYSGAAGDWNALHDGTGCTFLMAFAPDLVGTKVPFGTFAVADTQSGLEFTVLVGGELKTRVGNSGGVAFLVDDTTAGSTLTDETLSVVTYRNETGHAVDEFDVRVDSVQVGSGAFVGLADAGDCDVLANVGSRNGTSLHSPGVHGDVVLYSRYLNDYEAAAIEALATARFS